MPGLHLGRRRRLGRDLRADLVQERELLVRCDRVPASANDAPTGTLVASMTLPADAFGAAASRAVAKAGTWEDTSADATGTIGWARLRESGDGGGSSTTDRRVDFSVTESGGGGDIIVDNTDVNIGQPITVQTLSLSRA